MTKYIRTFYNDEKAIIRMSGCQHCPLMRYDQNLFMCECRFFRSPETNVVKDFVLVYSKNQQRVMDLINTPNWCLLPNSYLEMLVNNDIYSLMNGGIRVTTSPNNTSINLIDASDQNYSLNNVTKYKEQQQSTIIIPDHRDMDDILNPFYDDYHNYRPLNNNTFTTPPVVKKYNVCSLCGEEDESVERNENMGMCDDCWEEASDDQNKLNQAYINNFRLKRNVKIEPTVQFKLLKEINT